MRVVHVDDDFLETFGMDIVQGRIFSKDRSTETARKEAMVNETAAEIMGMKSPIGKQLSTGEQNLKIIGVVKDYHLRSLHEKIDPLILLYRPDISRVMFVRLGSDNITETVDDIKRISPAIDMEMDRLSRITDLVYVHVDLDILDPEDIPGAGLPVEDGPTADELAEALEVMFEYPSVKGFGMASYPWRRDKERRGLRSVYRLVEGVIKGIRNR